ncbi:MAG: NADH:ubiquinone oxidoreductase [Magnetococcales bacterium]|nr:NADH:ubiquinone oxidoreductase [Magnetococcales bacterium]MBF0156652.1 NADH:ubiquinone oxidoreductase [Magnetococcales bacterium]
MKPKVAFFDFAGCEGCQLTILDCEDLFLDLLERVDIVEFREALSETAPRFDVAFIEGSIHREEDAERLREIRSRSTLLVTLGACAGLGNVQARSNFLSPATNFRRVYGEEELNRVQADPEFWPLWAHTRVRSVKEVVPVDYELRGCPVVAEEFLHLVKSLVVGTVPHVPTVAVCVECKMQENECVFDRGETCLGQITYGGCKAVCIGHGYRCDGCRGLLPQANLEAHRQLLRDKGLDESRILERYRLFGSAEAWGRERRP